MFSIIIPAYNMGAFIGEALESVGTQIHPAWEVIVVNDCGSEDGTEEHVMSFASKHPQHRVEYIRHEENMGVGAARNTAIKAAKGDFLAFLDPDDLWLPKYLQRMRDTIKVNPDIDFVYSPAVSFRETNNKKHFEPFCLHSWQTAYLPHSLVLGNFIQPSSSVVRKALVEGVGGFSTNPDIQAIEDCDLWIRLSLAGAHFHFLDENLVHYRRHAGGASNDLKKMQQLNRNLAMQHLDFYLVAQSKIIRHALEDLARTKRALRNPFRYLLEHIFGH